MRISKKIKRLRILNNLTQEELTDRAELSKGFIPQLERDLTSPPIVTLMDILQCLDTTPADFFSEKAPGQPVFRKADHFEKRDSELRSHICWLIPNAQKDMMEPIPLTLEPGDRMAGGAPHVGEELGYVLSSNLELYLGNEIRHVKKGESFCYRSEKSYYVSSRIGCTLLYANAPPSFQIERRDHKFMSTLVDLQHISKSFDDEMVFDDLNSTVLENSSMTLLGPLGCGKAVTLHTLGGFMTPDSGGVMFDGQDITSLPSSRRQPNTVFRKYALFPHVSVAEDIAFGLRIKEKSKAYIDDKIRYALKLVSPSDLEKHDANSLSDGQQQRTAIARTIVNEPHSLFFDEPLGVLDLKLRQDMQYEPICPKKGLNIIFVYVAYDQEKALTTSNTIVIMNQGYIQRMGVPEQIYNEPESAPVADFTSNSNIIGTATVHNELVNTSGANFRYADKGFGQNKPVDVVIHPGDAKLVKPEDSTLTDHVTRSAFKDVHYRAEVITENDYKWFVQSAYMFEPGQAVGITIDPFNIQTTNRPASEDEEAVVSE